MRTKILREINEEFHQGDKLNAALENSDILTELVKCFSEDDATIRELASRAVIKVACTEKGRAYLVHPSYDEDGTEIPNELIPQVKNLFNDEVVEIRANAYKILINVAEFTEGIDQVINHAIIQVLVDKLVAEKN